MNEQALNLTLFLTLFIAASAYAQPSTKASILANTCAGCHGPDGNSMGQAAPNISGLSDQYIIDAMEAYKEGDRPSTIMGRIAKGYSEQQIELLAAHFSQLPMKWPKQTTQASQANKGKKLHDQYCAKCHLDNGRSSEEDAGILANQKMPFLKYTLKDVLSGDYQVSLKMTDQLKALQKAHGKQGLEHIIQFYGSQSQAQKRTGR